ncbi:MAG: hypothetical protein MI810_00670 [Flavobacteriales bacterium]|nr:hypothetical protein [Flavobacteriales bacterium]
MEISEKQKKRFGFLKLLYEVTEGQENCMVNMWELGKELKLSKADTSSIFDYLSGQGLIQSMALGGGMRITHEGIVEIEKALTKPDEPTEYFPPINIIQVNEMKGGVIQQGTNGSSISIVSKDNVDEIENYLSCLSQFLKEISLDTEFKSEISADIETIRQQNKSPKPKKAILKESLKSIKTALEGATGGVIGALATPKAQELISQAKDILDSLP